MQKKIFLFISTCILFISGCQVKEKWHTTTFLFFDTVCELRVQCSSSLFNSAQKEVHRIFSDIEKNFSPESKDLSSPLVLSLFRKSLKIYQDTDGCFDITVAPLTQAWGFLNNSYRIPTAEELKSITNKIGMEKIEIKKEKIILPKGVAMDWGGVAKGFGIDLASNALKEMGIKKGFVNAGGDLSCWGKNPNNQSWQIGIKHPRQSGLFGVISIAGIGAATTGDYQRFFILDGNRYHHVFDPKTGYPAQGKQSVTVIGPETLVCDALSTALFVAFKPERILEKYPSYGAVFIDSSGIISFRGKAYPFRSLK